MTTTDTDQKFDAILAAIKGLEARVARIETGSEGAGGGRTGEEVIHQGVPPCEAPDD
jgi:hypothetical protein